MVVVSSVITTPTRQSLLLLKIDVPSSSAVLPQDLQCSHFTEAESTNLRIGVEHDLH